MSSTKKAQGMSLNTVIIAIIVLVVLVVLVMIFTGYFGKVFTPTVKDCVTVGGICTDKDCSTDTYGPVIAGATGCTGTSKCCRKVPDIA